MTFYARPDKHDSEHGWGIGEYTATDTQGAAMVGNNMTRENAEWISKLMNADRTGVAWGVDDGTTTASDVGKDVVGALTAFVKAGPSKTMRSLNWQTDGAHAFTYIAAGTVDGSKFYIRVTKAKP